MEAFMNENWGTFDYVTSESRKNVAIYIFYHHARSSHSHKLKNSQEHMAKVNCEFSSFGCVHQNGENCMGAKD